MKRIILLIPILFLTLSGCAHQPEAPTPTRAILLPMVGGWFNGEEVYYITTDVSDQAMAQKLHANYAPRLSDAILPHPRPIGVRSAVERVYVFPEGDQGSILPSSPTPLGHESKDVNYSPIWQVYLVRWEAGKRKALLTSEESLLAAQEQSMVSIEKTEVIVNCPVIKTKGATLGLPQPGQGDW